MFSLIISIISIALVAALAAATVYFGGAAFNKGSAGADASTFINAGQQISGAFTLAAADGFSPTTVAELNTGLGTGTVKEIYLSQVPSYKGTGLVGIVTSKAAIAGEYVVTSVSDQVCTEIVKRATGKDVIDTIDTANDFDTTDLYGCVESTEALAPVGGVATIAGDHVAFYKIK